MDSKVKESLETSLKLKDMLASAHAELDKCTKALCDRWANILKLISTEVDALHPPSKHWKKYVIQEPNKEKMIAMTKDEKIKEIGGLLPKIKKFTKELEDFCGESLSTAIRLWYAKADFSFEPAKVKQGCLGDMKDAYTQGKLVLAVVNALKAIHVKGPKAKDTPHVVYTTRVVVF